MAKDSGRIYTGAPCSCRRGIERDNYLACEGTGRALNFRAMRERFLQVAREENCDLGAARTVADAIGGGHEKA